MIVTTRATVTSHRVRTLYEECSCDNCGAPIEVGDRAFFAESAEAEAVGCSRLCSLDAHHRRAEHVAIMEGIR